MATKKFLKRPKSFSKFQLLVFAVAFGAIGLVIWRSLASNPNLPGDLNNDNTVNIQDLSILLSNYGTSNSSADINSDGTVNVLDMSILLSHYGQSYSGGGGTVTCTTTITNSANLLNTYNAAHAGDTICIGVGVTIDQGQIDLRNAIGTAVAPITITSADYSHPATILGRMVTHPPANYITFSHLYFNVKVATSASSWTIGSDHVTLSHDDISNNNTGICINTIDDSTYGTAHYTLIDSNRIHNCGEIPSVNTDHGIYDIGYYSTITNNFIYDNVDRGIQLRQDHNATVKYNVSNNNGEGMIVGDTNIAAVNDEVAYNIFSNSNIRYNIEEFWSPNPPANPNNRIHDNCVWTTRTGQYTENGGVPGSFVGATVTNTKIANPQYVNAGAKDFRLQAGSACAGYGVQAGITPGI